MTPIEEIIPLYLADRISLDSAIQSASQTPRNALLLAALKESRSLPRSIDTDPTTPTPDLPSPSQDKLLQLIRALDSRARAQDRDSGIALDDLISMSGDGYGYGSEAEEQYNALHNFTNEAVRDFATYFLQSGSGPSSTSTSTVAHSRSQHKRPFRSSLFRVRSETRYTDADADASVDVDTFADEYADPSIDIPTAPGPSSRSDLGHGHRRRRSSGVEKHLYNFVSFLAFLTKEKLLLYPNVGERVAVEMISETLYHPPSHSHSHSQSWDWNRNRNRNRSHTVPQDAGFDSKGKEREEVVTVAVNHEPWFGFVSSTGPGNEVSVTAVALWLIIMGEELYQRAHMERRESKARVKSKGRTEMEGGDVWTRLSEVVGREWETWTSRLQFLSLREDLGISAREQAAEAAAVMRRVYD